MIKALLIVICILLFWGPAGDTIIEAFVDAGSACFRGLEICLDFTAKCLKYFTAALK